ncbi:SMI1/KNR4 family protein [Chryseomicrobium sp. FSL W7-1435]|uniref:SMI1/KNR4 family protein n=1 Tax=Chryseomicrobium sp. FSL W7-1435 TaxID=2921704 RepID=UPI003159D008
MNKFQLWEDDAEDFYYKGKLTEEMITDFQQESGFVLPDTYKKLLKERNGFQLVRPFYPVSQATSWAENHINVDHILGIGTQIGLKDSAYMIEEWELPSNKLLVFSNTAPTFVCLDYRKGGEPQVVYIDVDSNQDFVVADSFEILLKGLEESIEE